MNKYKLSYARLGELDIYEEDYQTKSSLIVDSKLKLLMQEAQNKCVYLMTFNSGRDRREHDITISTKVHVIQDMIDYNDENIVNLFIQEYDSFEEAYGVALSMQECCKLCYKDH